MSIGNPWDDRLDRIGRFGAYLFALFALLGAMVANVGLVLFLSAFLLRFRHQRLLGRDPVVISCLLFILYLGLHGLVFYPRALTDAMAQDMVEAGVDWAKLALFIPLAYWASGNPERILRLLLLGLLGFILGLLRKIDWGGFDTGFFQTRFEDYLPANAFGMFAAIATLGLISLRRSFWGNGRNRLATWARMLLWGLCLAIAVEGLVLSHSRGSWLAFLIALVPLLWPALQKLMNPDAHPGRRGYPAASLVIAALLALFVATQWGQIQTRLLSEVPVVMQLLEGKRDRVQSSSIAIRLSGGRYGVEEWGQSPWFGFGAGSSRHRIAASGRPELMLNYKDWIPHLHNTYLEILYQLGLVGLIPAVAVVWTLARGTALEYRAGRVPGDLYLFLSATLVFVLVWNLFEYRIVHHDWRSFWILCAGVAYSFRLRALLQNARSQPHR